MPKKYTTDTPTFRASTVEFLDRAWGEGEWKPPATMPRRNCKGEPFPEDHPWSAGEMDMLKDITILALSRGIELDSLYQPGGAVFKAAVASDPPRWCLHTCIEARRTIRKSGRALWKKKKVIDDVMAEPAPRRPILVKKGGPSCEDHSLCLCSNLSQILLTVSDFGVSLLRTKSSQSAVETRLEKKWWKRWMKKLGRPRKPKVEGQEDLDWDFDSEDEESEAEELETSESQGQESEDGEVEVVYLYSADV